MTVFASDMLTERMSIGTVHILKIGFFQLCTVPMLVMQIVNVVLLCTLLLSKWNLFGEIAFFNGTKMCKKKRILGFDLH
jgi:hypothetical protein